MEKYELSVSELEAQEVELLPDRAQMVRVRVRADVGDLGGLLGVDALVEIDTGLE